MPCIYCKQELKNIGKGEHVVPQAFGTYASKTPTIKVVCGDCNNYFGRTIDQILAQQTIEGVGRSIRGITSSAKGAIKKATFKFPSDESYGLFAGAVLQGIDRSNGNILPLLPQLLVYNRLTKEFDSFQLSEIPTVDFDVNLYGVPGRPNEPNAWRARALSMDLSGFENVVKSVRNRGIDFRTDNVERPALQVQDGKVMLEVENIVDNDVKRALLKILINAYTWVKGEDINHQRWDPIKEYVRYGCGESLSRGTPGPINKCFPRFKYVDPDAIVLGFYRKPPSLIGFINIYSYMTYEFLIDRRGGSDIPDMTAYMFIRGEMPKLLT